MKNIKLVIFILFISISTFAESRSRMSRYYFVPGWFYGVNGGINSFLGEGIGTYLKEEPLNSLAPFARVTIGYNYNTVIGFRGFIGLSEYSWPDNSTVKKFNAENLTLDITYNLSNKLALYNLSRRFDISLFVGTGVSFRNKGPFGSGYLTLIGRGGVQGDYHISNALDLNLIFEASGVGENYNEAATGIPFDMFPAASLGLSYHLNSYDVRRHKYKHHRRR